MDDQGAQTEGHRARMIRSPGSSRFPADRGRTGGQFRRSRSPRRFPGRRADTRPKRVPLRSSRRCAAGSPTVGNYSAPVPIGSTMRALAVGEIVGVAPSRLARPATSSPAGSAGRSGPTVDAGRRGPRRVAESDLPHSLALGVLGINGVTALIGLTVAGEPRAGETVVVSTAAGAVGSAVGQIARQMAAAPSGSPAGRTRSRSAATHSATTPPSTINAPGLANAVGDACPDGVNVYFDNTSGAISDAVHSRLAVGARVVVCGTASIASWDPWPTGPRIERWLLVKRARAHGFIVFDYRDRWDASSR